MTEYPFNRSFRPETAINFTLNESIPLIRNTITSIYSTILRFLRACENSSSITNHLIVTVETKQSYNSSLWSISLQPKQVHCEQRAPQFIPCFDLILRKKNFRDRVVQLRLFRSKEDSGRTSFDSGEHVHEDVRTRLRTFSDNVVHRLVLLASQPLSLSPSLSLFLSLPPFDHLSRPRTLAVQIFPSPLHLAIPPRLTNKTKSYSILPVDVGSQ